MAPTKKAQSTIVRPAGGFEVSISQESLAGPGLLNSQV